MSLPRPRRSRHRAATRHLLLEDGAELIGCLRLLDDGDAARIGRVVVTPSERGHGYAERLLREALHLIGSRRARLDAQVGLTEWYTGFDFFTTGPAYDEDGIVHLPMERAGSAG